MGVAASEWRGLSLVLPSVFGRAVVNNFNYLVLSTASSVTFRGRRSLRSP